MVVKVNMHVIKFKRKQKLRAGIMLGYKGYML